MLIRRGETVVVQGITGRQGSYWTERMVECGTQVVAGASPGRGGRTIIGIPVYDSVVESARHHELDASVLFVPPMWARAAALDAIEAGVGKLVLLTEHVPAQDVMEVLARAAAAGTAVLGPNTAGLVVPGETSVGIMPGFARNIFQPGPIGVISRSGSLGTLVSMELITSGFGQSAFIGIGGDPILGTTTLDAVRLLDADERTGAIVLVGEIGGVMEEEAAAHIASMTKPVVAFIAGRTAPPGQRMGHAGAIVTGDRGSGESKVRALTEAGAVVVDVPSAIGPALRSLGVQATVSPADRALVSEAFNQLHPLHREVLRKAYCLGWTTGHIAADLNVTEPVVKSRLHYALRTLRFTLIDPTPRLANNVRTQQL
ncbi:MAG TPA: sigma factor-like helix-turn-helix DNA-binding protein [Mycobacterium sp.]|nr:sigma factor-like helix-turn-helix DNA-binding protein [Mycobacterium sp.]